ncbi:MAG TPA: formimidoylglutamase [Flavipsychrobacter sp.]|nr:formimidoylglutamase [Flavipsychrobacter sp.]
MTHLRIAARSYIDSLINKRPNETKLGEQVNAIHNNENWEEELIESAAKYVLLGIPEDIGVRANYGLGGTNTLWEPALKAILNVQNTNALDGASILLLGDFDFRDLMQQSLKMDVMQLRELVAKIDEEVAPVIEKIVAARKIPIIIGGGHNNAYPLLQGLSMAKNGSVNCINLDAHSDFRIMEGRHSGNGFHYAKQRGYLNRYTVIGLHQNYNAQNIIDQFVIDIDLLHFFYEDIFLHHKYSFDDCVKAAITHTSGRSTGIELDLDCIEHTLSSAATPCGITSLQARQYITTCANSVDAAYLHIPEGAVHLRNGKEDTYTAKLVAYLVTDFIRANNVL